MQRKTLNWIFKRPSQQEQMILSSSMNEKTYLKEFSKLVQVSSFYQYSHGLRMVRSLLQSSSPREKEKKGENSHKTRMTTLSCGRSPSIYRHFDGERDPSPPLWETSTTRVQRIFSFFYFLYFFHYKFRALLCLASPMIVPLSLFFLLFPLLGFSGPFLLSPNEP